MKCQLLIFLLLILGGYSQECKSQNKLRPLKQFNNDTMAYMRKNYDGGMLYSRGKTIGNVLEDADLTFKSYVLGETRDDYPAIMFILLFTKPAEEVRALYRAGKPVLGVFCDFEGSYNAYNPGGDIYGTISPLGTNRFNDLNRTSKKALREIKINWAEFTDQKEWCSMYKVE